MVDPDNGTPLSGRQQIEETLEEGVPVTNTERVGNTVWKSVDDDYQTKIDEAGAGGTVIFEPGDHGLPSSKVTLPTPADGEYGITLWGYGARVKCLQNDWTFEGTSNSNYDTSNNISGHRILGFNFYQDSWADRGQGAIHFDGALQSLVRDCDGVYLVYGVKDEATNGFSWANKYLDNDFEVVQRPIWVDGSHDTIVRGNHIEGRSGRVSGSFVFDDAEGAAAGISFVNTVNGQISGNEIEVMRGDGGEAKGVLIKDHNNNLEYDNNYVEGADRGVVIDYSTDTASQTSDLNITDSLGVIDNTGVDWTCPNTDVQITLDGCRTGLVNVTGDCRNLNLAWTGGQRITASEIAVQSDDGTVDITGVGADNVPGASVGIFNGVYQSVTVSGGSFDELVLSNVTATDVSLSTLNIHDNRLEVSGGSGSSVTRMTVNGVTQSANGFSQFLLVGSGSTISNLLGDGNATGNGTAVTNSGTISSNTLSVETNAT
jgi:hypothetical protein